MKPQKGNCVECGDKIKSDNRGRPPTFCETCAQSRKKKYDVERQRNYRVMQVIQKKILEDKKFSTNIKKFLYLYESAPANDLFAKYEPQVAFAGIGHRVTPESDVKKALQVKEELIELIDERIARALKQIIE